MAFNFMEFPENSIFNVMMKVCSWLLVVLVLFSEPLYSQRRGDIYGVTRDGAFGNGVIFKIDTAGKQSTVFEFPFRNDGYAIANEFCEANDGMLYAPTIWGGTHNFGTIIRYNIKTGECIKKAEFNGENGNQPAGRLVKARNGKLYGVTNKEGKFGGGTLFEYDPVKNKLETKIHFNDTLGYAAFGTLTLGADGLIYGNTLQGGKYGSGVIFSYNTITSTYKVRHHFDHYKSGSSPFGAMAEVNKKLYGFTGYGSTDCILFEFDPRKNKLTKKLIFPSGVGARYSCDGMILHNGKLYGSADKDFDPYSGFIFEYNPSTNKLKILKKLKTPKYYDPVGVIAIANNKLYGVTRKAGAFDGTLFEFDLLTSELKTRYVFNQKTGGPPNCLMIASNGRLYGATSNGGRFGMGSIFEFDPLSNRLRHKNWFRGSDNGEQIAFGMARAKNGKLYGMMGTGGKYNGGTLFEFDPAKQKLTKKIDFDGSKIGRAPNTELFAASNGKIYGTTTYGGQHEQGTLFEYDPETNTVVVKVSFNNPSKNRFALMGPTEGPDGKLYGVWGDGFTSREGVLYKYDLANDSIRELASLKEGTYGNTTFTGIYCLYGKIYTWLSSHYQSGTVLLEYDPANKKIDTIKISPFGDYCMSKSLAGREGKIWGFCMSSKAEDKATALFTYDPVTKQVEEKRIISYDCAPGYLMAASDGILYGTLGFSGPGKLGFTFKYDTSTDQFTRIADFVVTNGWYPVGNLVELKP